MLTVLRSGPYRFHFYSHEPNEPPHVHVDRDDLSAKFWLNPVGMARNLGFNARELRRLQLLVTRSHLTNTELAAEDQVPEELSPQEGREDATRDARYVGLISSFPIYEIASKHHTELLEAWHGHLGADG